MKEKFEPFKELLKALREIKYAIGGKNSGTGEGNGNGNDIVLPKYLAGWRGEGAAILIMKADYENKMFTAGKNLATSYLDIYSPVPSDINGNVHSCVYTKDQIDEIKEGSLVLIVSEWFSFFVKFTEQLFEIVDIYSIRGENNGQKYPYVQIYDESINDLVDIEEGKYFFIELKEQETQAILIMKHKL